MSFQIENGKRTLEQLDHAGLTITAAYWAFDEAAENWKYFLCEPSIAIEGPKKAYGRIGDVLKAHPSGISLLDVYLVPSSNDLVRTVSSVVTTEPSEVSNVWFAGKSIRGESIPDMYIYRMAQPKRSPTH